MRILVPVERRSVETKVWSRGVLNAVQIAVHFEFLLIADAIRTRVNDSRPLLSKRRVFSLEVILQLRADLIASLTPKPARKVFSDEL
jgi:hypothetical protein